MGAVTCNACKGTRGKYIKSRWVECRPCNGRGTNPNLWATSCAHGCGREIIYRIGTTPPRFCKDCRNKQVEKQCGQLGCTNTIRYKVGWDNVPTYCKRCENKRREGATASSCPGTGWGVCGKIVWSPPGKRFSHCPECSQRLREQEAAKWKTKSCPGLQGQGYCGHEIRYRVDWDKIPDICPQCREKAKQQRDERNAKMKEKPCGRNGCHNQVRYSTDWDHPPSFCKDCSAKRKALQAEYPNINRKYETVDTSYIMPGMKKSIGAMGGTKGQHYPRQGKIHCMVFEGMRGNDLHYSWDLDPITGEVIGEVYMHPNDPRGR